MSRELLEWHVRRRLAASPRVTFLPEHDVTGLLPSPDGTTITGVEHRARGEDARRAGADGAAAGRPRGGRQRPRLAHAALAGSARLRAAPRRPTSTRSWPMPVATTRRPRASGRTGRASSSTPSRPSIPRGGALFPVEGGRWLVTLAGIGGEAPPIDDEGFLAFARTLRSPIMYEAIRQAQPAVAGGRLSADRTTSSATTSGCTAGPSGCSSRAMRPAPSTRSTARA